VSSSVSALVVAPPLSEEKIVTGLQLGERARRVLVRAGVDASKIHLVRSAGELVAARKAVAGEALIFVRADGWVVAGPLVEPLLHEAAARVRIAVDAAGYAGAIYLPAGKTDNLLELLAHDLKSGDSRFAGGELGAEKLEVTRRARHPARTKEELRAADAWQFELVNKPLDAGLTRYFYRPAARPLTRIFLRLPFTPNHITIFSTLLSLVGCWIAAGPGYLEHVIGLCVLLAGGIVDCNDGEVARLRLEFSTLGGWLDAIGDDMARIALLLAMGWHVAPIYPKIPVIWLTVGALVLTVVAMLLIYWYCIFVIHTTNNQEYGQALGVGNAVPARKSLGRVIGDFFAQIARRDAMDLGALFFAIVALPVVPWAAMTAGGVIAFAWVLPTHFKLLELERQKKAASA
jgi:phosphatidylglycerophosphate synthase